MVAIFRREERPFRFLVSRLLWHSRLGLLLTTDCGDFRVRFYPSAMSALMWYRPTFGLADQEILRSCLRVGDTYVDVGANIGCLALRASKLVGSYGKVYAIEPHPRTFRFLQGNVRLNRAGNVSMINMACGERDGSVCFTSIRSDDQNRVATDGINVPVATLDVLLADVPHVRLLKIDVEGYEKFVLLGGLHILQRTDYVYFEVCDAHFLKYGYTTADVVHLLRSLGYRVAIPDSPELSEHYVAPICHNLVASRT